MNYTFIAAGVVLALHSMAPLTCCAERNHRDTSQYIVGQSVQPLVILGEGWTQQFVFINVSYYDPEPTIGTFSFYTKDGQPWRVPIKGRGTVDHVDLNIRPGQMVGMPGRS